MECLARQPLQYLVKNVDEGWISLNNSNNFPHMFKKLQVQWKPKVYLRDPYKQVQATVRSSSA